MNGFYSVAIDGPSGAGKSSLAKLLARAYGFIYVDTGAIYRTVALASIRAGVDRRDAGAIQELLPGLDISIAYAGDGQQRMYLNGEDVSEAIRMPEVSIGASDVSALACVRSFLLEMQRSFARTNNVIMDGRDIGTVVLPDAELKIFLTASAQARAERRLKELTAKGVETDFESVLRDIEYRDYQDTHRETAPLKEAADAVHVDTSGIDFNGSFELLCSVIESRLGIEKV